jgi:hypothetical protein
MRKRHVKVSMTEILMGLLDQGAGDKISGQLLALIKIRRFELLDKIFMFL